jgi:hypothetical protein
MKFKEFVLRKKILFISAVALLSLIVGAFLVWYFLLPVAKVNGETITRSDFRKEEENFEKMASYMEDESYSKDSTIRDALIERKIMDLAAKENSVTVSDEDIAEEIERVSESYNGGEKAIKGAYNNAYGLDESEFKQAIYYKLLKQKLTNSLLKQKSGKLIYVRFNTNNAVEELLNIKTEDLETNALKTIEDWKKQLDGGKEFAKLYSEIQAQNKYPALYGDEFVFDGEKSPVSGEDDTIAKTDIGKYSEVAKTPTYYAIYFVESGTNGKYNTWDDFIKSYSERFVKYSFIDYKQTALIKSKVNLVKVSLDKIFGTKSATASCASCSGCTGAVIKGTVKDTLGNNLSGATVNGTSNSSDYCNGSSSSGITAWCGYRTGSDTTSSTGYYSMGGGDGYSCRFNCAGGSVSVKADKGTKYYAVTKTVTVTNGSTKDVDFSLDPINYTITVKVVGTGTGSVTGSGINCQKGESATSADCTASINYDPAGDDITLTATPSSSSYFASWSGGGCSGDASTCKADVNSNVTVTATMNIKRYTITPSVETGCNISPSTAQIVNYNGSEQFTGSADAGYEFKGFSIDGGTTLQASPYTFSSVTANHTIRANCDPIPGAPTCSLSASPSSITGGSSTITWTTKNVASVNTPSPAGWTTKTTATGSQSVSPTSTTTYGLKALGENGTTINCTPATVSVGCAGTCDASVAPTVCAGTNYADSCGVSVCPGTKDCSCSPTSETMATGCGAGYTGQTNYQRDFSCPAGVWGSWYSTSSTCAPYCLITGPSVVSGATVKVDESINSAELVDGKATVNFAGSFSKSGVQSQWSVLPPNSFTWSTPVVSQDFSYEFNTPGIYNVRLSAANDGNCQSSVISIKITVPACIINGATSAEKIVAWVKGVIANTFETNTIKPINITFKPNLSNQLSSFTSKWQIKKGLVVDNTISNNPSAYSSNQDYTATIGNPGTYNIGFCGINGGDPGTNICFPTTVTSQVTNTRSIYGYCSTSRDITITEKPYCEIKSVSGEAPLVLRVSAKDERTGSTGQYVFRIYKNNEATPQEITIAAPAVGTADLVKTLESTGAYRVTVQRGTASAYDCETIDAVDANRINVTSPGSGSGGEVRPN